MSDNNKQAQGKSGRAGEIKPERASELRLARAANKKRKREERREGERGAEKVAGAPPAKKRLIH